MIDFQRPLILLLLIPWTVFTAVFYMVNRKSFYILKAKVSERFLDTITYYSGTKLILHSVIIFTGGLLLVIASAGPFSWGKIKEDVKIGRPLFEKAAAYKFRENIPLYNLANDKNEGKGSAPGKLTSDEKESIAKALKRIKKDSGNNSFSQTRAQQIRKGKEKAGLKVSW